MPKKTKSPERSRIGYKSFISGMEFERRVVNWLGEKGYVIRWRRRTKRLGEVDIIAEKGRVFRKVLFVECKRREKGKVTLRDFHKFVTKFEKFLRREPNAEGLFIYYGELEKDVRDYYNRSLDPDLAEVITIKKWPKRR